MLARRGAGPLAYRLFQSRAVRAACARPFVNQKDEIEMLPEIVDHSSIGPSHLSSCPPPRRVTTRLTLLTPLAALFLTFAPSASAVSFPTVAPTRR